MTSRTVEYRGHCRYLLYREHVSTPAHHSSFAATRHPEIPEHPVGLRAAILPMDSVGIQWHYSFATPRCYSDRYRESVSHHSMLHRGRNCRNWDQYLREINMTA